MSSVVRQRDPGVLLRDISAWGGCNILLQIWKSLSRTCFETCFHHALRAASIAEWLHRHPPPRTEDIARRKLLPIAPVFPRRSSLAHLGSGSLPFLCARHGSRAVGPPPTTHQSGPPCRLQRRTDAISPFRGPHHGRGHHFWSHCLLDCQCTALMKKDGSHRPVAVGETLRRLTAKVLLAAVSEHTTGLRPAQLGFRTKSDCEAIVHAIRRWVRDGVFFFGREEG